MNSDFTFDSEPLQKLLASAFAVQESGINAERLAAIVEIQRLIGDGDLNLDGAMHLIAEQARSVADASGSAIGLLKAGQLVYGAGTGSAATYVGRRVMATLSGSAPQVAMAEILRVENADADARIQSAICRQFGAKSLLILPIYCGRTLSGVLQIFFNEAHTFADQEVGAYRVFAGLVGEAMSSSSHPEHKAALATRLSGGNRVIGEATIRPPGARSATWMQTVGFPIFRRAWDLGIAAAALIAVVSFLLYGVRSSRMSQLAGSESGKLNFIERHAPSAPTQQVVHLSPDDSVGRNVMMRHSVPPVPPSPKWPFRSASQVEYFGDDVTVRYFVPQSAVMQTSAGETEIRRVSDDVSVRYFKRRRFTSTAPLPKNAFPARDGGSDGSERGCLRIR